MVHQEKQWVVLLVGFVVGFILASMFLDEGEKGPPVFRPLPGLPHNYSDWFRHMNLSREAVQPDLLSFAKNRSSLYMESDFLYERVPLLCVVIVDRVKNAYTVANTWGKRCNKILFYGTTSNMYLPVQKVTLTSSWQFLCDIIRHVWLKHHYHLHWVLFSKDDQFVIPENARYVLAPKNYLHPHYIGHKSMFWNQIFNSAVTPYILSRGAMEKLVERFTSSKTCGESGKYKKNEDYFLGKYLSEMGIHAEDARDEEGRERFHLFSLPQLLGPGVSDTLVKNSKRSVFPVVQGPYCCSSTSISFRFAVGEIPYLFSHLLYSVKRFSSGHLGNAFSSRYVETDEVWQKFIREEMGHINISHVTRELYYHLWEVKANSPEQFNKVIADTVRDLSEN